MLRVGDFLLHDSISGRIDARAAGGVDFREPRQTATMLLRAQRLLDLFRHATSAPRVPADCADRGTFCRKEREGEEEEGGKETGHRGKMRRSRKGAS